MWGRLEKENPTLPITLKNDSGLVPPSISPFPWANNIQKMETEEAKLAGMMTRNPKTTFCQFNSCTIIKNQFWQNNKSSILYKISKNMISKNMISKLMWWKKGFNIFSIFFLIDFFPQKVLWVWPNRRNLNLKNDE